MGKGQLYTLAEIAREMEITVDELVIVLKAEGLLDEDGLVTQKAKNAGLLIDSTGMELN